MSRGKCCQVILAILDQFLCLFVVFPLCISHWRGTWHLQDVYLLPHDYVLSSWSSLIIGTVLGILLALIHPGLVRLLKKYRRWVYVVGIRIYLYISGWAILGYWRGLWNLVDYYLTEGWVNSVIIYAIAQVISLLNKTSRANVGIPLAINIDVDEDFDHPDTRFYKTSTSKCFYLFDVIYTHLVVTLCNILVWRGLWNVLDTFLYPEDVLVSSIASLILGMGTVIILFLLAPLLAMASERLDAHHIALKLAYEGFIFVIGTWCVLTAWRGGWDLCRDYVIPDPRVGGWVCHVVGVVGLIIMQCFSSVSLNGIDIDGSYSQGQGLFPTQYLRYYLEEKPIEVLYSRLPAEMTELASLDLKSPGDDKLDLDSFLNNGHVLDGYTAPSAV